MVKQRQDAPAGPGGGERSEPEPGPAGARTLGVGTGRTKRYTPEERRWALDAWAQSGVAATLFARQWGVSVQTLYEWKRAVARGGPQALEHPSSGSTGRSRGPGTAGSASTAGGVPQAGGTHAMGRRCG
ncbi:MAG: transposase [Planctomycetes bacterium]|nr:transposase [Planctomycetota bacterium]